MTIAPSASTFQKLFNLSIDMLCVANLDGYFELVNPSFSKVLGYTDEELMAKPYLTYVHPDDVSNTLEEMEKTKRGLDAINFINRYRTANGEYVAMSWCATVDPESNLIYAVARDVTDSLNTQNRLLQIKAALRKTTILAQTDAKGIITDVNDKFCEISGYGREELIGKTHKIINSGVHSKEFFKALWETISQGKVWEGVITNKKKTGELYYVQSILIPIHDHNDQITEYLAIRQDITEKIFSQSSLSNTLKILNETSAIAKVGGWELEIETGELTWTDETFKILEVEKKVGQKPILPEGLQLFTEKYQPIIEDAINRAIKHGEPYALELEAQTAKGNVRWIFTNGKANFVDGKLKTLSGTIQDIHDKKLAESKYNRERQKSIHNSKLAALGELSASIAHEINNPLGVIWGYAELMQLSGDDLNQQDVTEKTDHILKSCERISHIVKSLRKFSRTDDGSDKSLCSIASIVNESILLTRPKLKRHFIKLSHQINTEATVLCNEIELEQVLVNLINNAGDAIKTSADKWIDISVTSNESAIDLLITDSGAGIPQEIKSKLFEPFFTTKSSGEGTGLGLAITKGILEDHGATISLVEDAVNTRFKITLPVTIEQENR